VRRHRRADVQGLRALAVLLVVLFHAGFHVRGGFTGVDVFFVISGFVITRMLAAELAETGGIQLKRFYGRRVKRLLPALALLIVCVTAAATLLNPFGVQGITAKTGIATGFFTANAYLYAAITDTYFTSRTQLDPLLHTWTLAVEEQFYVVFPAILLVAWRLSSRRGRSRRAWAVGAIAIVSAASFLLSIWFSYALPLPVSWPRPSDFAFYSSPTRAWEFGLGALLALEEERLARLPRLAAGTLATAGLGAILVGASLAPDRAHFPGLYALVPVCGAAAVIASGMAGSVGASRLLELRAATWLGDRSYSWYLWHWPFIVDARAIWPGSGWAAPTAAAASLLPAWASYRYAENPIRFSTRLRGRRIAYLGIACVAASVASCVALFGAHNVLGRVSTIRSAERSQLLHVDFNHGCMDSLATLPERLHGSCTWRVPHPLGLIVFVGDSNAGHFSEPIIAAGNQVGYDVVADTNSACPFIVLRVHEAFHTEQYCRHAVLEALQGLVEVKPALVVTADRSDGYLARNDVGLGLLSGGPFTYSATDKAVLWQRGLSDLLKQINAANIPVLLVHPVPRQLGVTLGVCAVIRLLLQGCNSPVGRQQATSALASAVRAENEAVAHASRASTLTLENELCNATTCATARNGVDLYLDEKHLSEAGASTLEHAFAVAIRRALASRSH
jgi:peptidoglycan/LPS O-acetylase OafA/YrhL